MRDSNRSGWVYYALAADADEQLVKIGFSAHLRNRLVQIQRDPRTPTVARQRPIILAVERGTPRLEARRHSEWWHRHAYDEWFRYEADLRAHISSVAIPDLIGEALTARRASVFGGTPVAHVYGPGEVDF